MQAHDTKYPAGCQLNPEMLPSDRPLSRPASRGLFGCACVVFGFLTGIAVSVATVLGLALWILSHLHPVPGNSTNSTAGDHIPSSDINYNAYAWAEQLKRMQGFQKLDSGRQKKLLAYVGGDNPVSSDARNGLYFLHSTRITEEDKPETFQKFLTEQPGARESIWAQEGTFDKQRRSYTLTAPRLTRHPYVNTEKVWEYRAEIEGQKIRILYPKTVPKKYYCHKVEEVARGLAALPALCRRAVQAVYVESRYYSTRYMQAGSEGIIWVFLTEHIASQTQLDAGFIHETGHILSRRRWGDDSDSPRWKPWRDAIKRDIIFPSKYARKNPEEDLAETLLLYYMVPDKQRAELRQLMPQRFRILDKIIDNK